MTIRLKINVPLGGTVQFIKTIHDLKSIAGESHFMEEYCDHCDSIYPLNHFKFVDGIVIERPQRPFGFLCSFHGMASCKDWRKK